MDDVSNNKKLKSKNAQFVAPASLNYKTGIDRQFTATVILLLCMGTVMIFSASYAFAMENNGDSFFFAKRQVLWVALGLIAMFVTSRPYRFYRSPLVVNGVMAVALLLMVLVLAVGTAEDVTKGATRWLYIGPISFQPSEFLKFAVILYFSKYIMKYSDKIASPFNFKNFLRYGAFEFIIIGIGVCIAAFPMIINSIFEEKTQQVYQAAAQAGEVVEQSKSVMGIFDWFFYIVGAAVIVIGILAIFRFDCIKKSPDFYYGVVPYVIVLLICGVLLFLQPHMSGMIIIGLIIFMMMWLGGTRWQYLAMGGVAGGCAMALLLTMKSHSSGRLQVWLDPFKYLKGGGWQPAQSLYAIGSGGFWGVGYGNSRQKHLYLPEPQNDYIFSILCEEMGFIGALIVMSVFIYLIYRGIVIALKSPDLFSKMLVVGIMGQVAIQVILNIAVVTNTIPSTGISLPFFSYGGTSLIILMGEMGVVLSVSRYSLTKK